MKLNPNEKNAFEALWQLISLSKIKVTATSLKNAILEHNDSTTMLGLSDVLNEFNIPNLATRLMPEQLYEIPLPAVAYLDTFGGTFVTVTKVENDIIEWRHDINGIYKESIQDFIRNWHGITILIEKNETSGEADYKEKRKQEVIETLRIPFLITGLVACLGFLLYTFFNKYPISENIQFYSLLLTKTIGASVSIMLVWYSLDKNNTFLKSVCQLNKTTNCNSILNSKAAKLFGWLTWSEIGLFYFTGGFFSLLILKQNCVPFLQWLGVLALPYTVWSIYYQALIAKEWCPLCISIQIIIWAEFAISLQMGLSISSFTDLNWLPPLTLSLWVWGVIPLLWTFIKKPLQKSIRTDDLYREFQKIKFNPDYLKLLMNKQVFLPPFFSGMKTIQMGSPSAVNQLIIVLEPNCASCRQTYLMIKKLVEKSDDIHVSIILATSLTNNQETEKIVRTILSQDTDTAIKIALDEWFKDDNNSLKKWVKRKQIQEENFTGQEQLTLHLRWLELAEIETAPTKFLNGHEIPRIYMANDILKLLNYSKVGFANQ